MDAKDELIDFWITQNGRNHPTSSIEWWCAETFFKTVEDNKEWNLKAVLTEWYKENKSKLNITLFDKKSDRYFSFLSEKLTSNLETKKDSCYIKYENSYIKGKFPDYEMTFEDKDNDILIFLKYHSNIHPHWISQEITDGTIPMGLGFYKYGFIPKCEVTGEMKIKEKKYEIKGIGYYEHVWGNISFENPFTKISKKKHTISSYAKLIGWWIHNHKIKIPKSLEFCNENNPFGYDWTWALLDNGWSLFYGNSMFFIKKGPALGILYLNKGDNSYEQFCDINFEYRKTRYIKKYDFYYPSEIKFTAKKDDKKLELIFSMVGVSREYVSLFRKKAIWKGLVICEAPGIVKGNYYDGSKKIPINGICKIEPQRQIPRIGHNSLKLDFYLPPKGFGCKIEFDSHFLNKKIGFIFQLKPKLKVRLNF